ncbi:MAG: hypothetical protein Q8N83_13660 [Ignavibacteria bacterium]|nr:hypothetical protein [Ignavibacteria bacterium]
MELNNIFILIGAFAVIWYVVTTILIYESLRKRGIKVNFLVLKFLILKYAYQYKDITKKETGKIGSLFYQWLISINIVLVAAILLFLNSVLFK